MEEGKNETSAERAVRYKAERTSSGRETLDAESRMSKMINEITGILSDKDKLSQENKINKYIGENVKPFLGKKDSLVVERIIGGSIFLSILRDGDDGQRNAIGMGSISEIEKILPEGLKEFSGKVRDHIVDSENLKLTIDGLYKEYEGSENSLMFKELLYKKIAETDVPENEMGQKIMILATLSEKMAPGGEVKDETQETRDKKKDVPKAEAPTETQETSDESDEDVDSFFEGMDGGGDRNEDVPEVVTETQETAGGSDEDVSDFFKGMDGEGDKTVEGENSREKINPKIDELRERYNDALINGKKDSLEKIIKGVGLEGKDLNFDSNSNSFSISPNFENSILVEENGEYFVVPTLNKHPSSFNKYFEVRDHEGRLNIYHERISKLVSFSKLSKGVDGRFSLKEKGVLLARE